MKEKIVIVGGGHFSGDLMANIMLQNNLDSEDVVLFSAKDEKQLAFQTEPYLIYEPPPFIDTYAGKEFVCKGKHQYRKVKKKENDGDGGGFIKVDWVCQCGRKL